MAYDRIHKEGNYVRYHEFTPKCYARIVEIKENHTPFIKIQTLPEGNKKSVSLENIGYIITTSDHLLRLGFRCKEGDFYEQGDLIISKTILENGKTILSSGFRVVKSYSPWGDKSKYYVGKDGINDNLFNEDFYEVNELNTLMDLLRQKNIQIAHIDYVLGLTNSN